MRRQFFLSYRDRIPPIRYALSSQSSQAPIGYSASSRLVPQPADGLSSDLSWTHYRVLMRVQAPDARSFYEA